jgi:hypothetical protein
MYLIIAIETRGIFKTSTIKLSAARNYQKFPKRKLDQGKFRWERISRDAPYPSAPGILAKNGSKLSYL